MTADEKRMLNKVIKAARKRLHFKSERATEEMLGYAAGTMTEAYRIGAEEAQSEILFRLQALGRITP